MLRQAAHADMLEQRGHCHWLRQCLVVAGMQAHQAEAGGAGFEEGLIRLDVATDDRHEQPAQLLFKCAQRCRRQPVALPLQHLAQITQRLAINLAARRARPGVNPPVLVNPHMRRQVQGDLSVKLLYIGQRALAVQPGHQSGCLPLHGHHRVAHLSDLHQRGFDLPQFKTLATDLDLLIVPAQVVQAGVCISPRKVAGAIEQGQALRLRQLDEARGIQRRVGEVAARNHRPRHQQVALTATRHRPVIFVHQQQTCIAHCPPDRRAQRPVLNRRRQTPGADHVGFGRAVMIEHPCLRHAAEPVAQGLGAQQLLARRDHFAQRLRIHALADSGLRQMLQGHARQEQPFDARLHQVAQQCLGILPPTRVDQVVTAPAAEGAENLLKRHIERQHGKLQGH